MALRRPVAHAACLVRRSSGGPVLAASRSGEALQRRGPLQPREPPLHAVNAQSVRHLEFSARSSSSSSTAPATSESEWRLYLALDKRDEAAHVALARFVSGFWELHAEAYRQLDADGDGSLSKEELAKWGHDVGLDKQHVVKVQGATESLRLPTTITRDVARELLARCGEGAVLAAADFQRLLQQTRQALLAEPAINRIPAPKMEGESVVVVGDLHGCISDLARVIELGGAPGQTTYVFNGDFVDRGRHGVEVVACLCALKLAHPTSVFLNRGNHECKALSRTYGLEKEVKQKYRGASAMMLFEELSTVFAALPLGAVIGGAEGDSARALVVHGGIPRDTYVRIADLENGLGIDRASADAQKVCKRRDIRSSLTSLDPLDEDDGSAFWVEDLLWSDPVPSDPGMGIEPNQVRKAGCLFGLGAVDRFLRREGLTTLVRSHEVVRDGVEHFRCGDSTEIYTVFSCSNYPDKRGENNAGAIRFGHLPHTDLIDFDEMDLGGLSGVEVLRWATTFKHEPKAIVDSTTAPRQAQNTVQSLAFLIASHRHGILEACEQAEAREASSSSRVADGMLSTAAWSDAMAGWGSKMGLPLPSVDWLGLLPLLRAAFSPGAATDEGFVDYRRLLSELKVETAHSGSNVSEKDIMSLYDHHEELSVIFAWIDVDNDGKLSLDEVTKAVRVLNEGSSDPIDAEALFRAMDIDGSGCLDRHEFMECFRLAGMATAR